MRTHHPILPAELLSREVVFAIVKESLWRTIYKIRKFMGDSFDKATSWIITVALFLLASLFLYDYYDSRSYCKEQVRYHPTGSADPHRLHHTVESEFYTLQTQGHYGDKFESRSEAYSHCMRVR